MNGLVIVSGGMDSTTLLYYLLDQGHSVDVLTVNYNQRHRKEVAFARQTCERLSVSFSLVDLSSVGQLLAGSSLTDASVDVPKGHYAAETMKVTVVPNRNAIFLAVAYGVAEARGLDFVGYAAHAGDHPIYLDCRPAFATAFEEMEWKALGRDVRLLAPFIDKTKADIVIIGDALGVPYGETWSCYKGGEVHCGKCGTCVERKEAFELAGVEDPTDYRAV